MGEGMGARGSEVELRPANLTTRQCDGVEHG
jgi:hypothetical protein